MDPIVPQIKGIVILDDEVIKSTISNLFHVWLPDAGDDVAGPKASGEVLR